MSRHAGSPIAFFDMDHTLIDNDCDVSWKEFLVAEGLAPQDDIAESHRFWELYRQGRLPETEFLLFQLRQFIGRTPDEIAPLAQRHYERHVGERVYPEARRAIEACRRDGIETVILTATNRAIADPLRRALGIDAILATELEMNGGHFTGRIAGRYCIREGKIERAEAHCRERGARLDEATYYGDSLSDIPMLECVATPIVVNPGAELLERAERSGWRIERWSLEG